MLHGVGMSAIPNSLSDILRYYRGSGVRRRDRLWESTSGYERLEDRTLLSVAAPTVNPIPDQYFFENAAARLVTLNGIAVSGIENRSLRVTAFSDNSAVVPHPTVNYQSPDSTGTLTIQPAPQQGGVASIVVTVEDGGMDNNLATPADNETFTRSFLVTVIAVNEVNVPNVVVDARSDLSHAGRTSTPDPANRLLPVLVDLPHGTGRWIEFPSITGTAVAGPDWPVHGPDGGTQGPANTQGTNIFAARGISGVIAPSFLFTGGVFLTDNQPVVAPPRLDYQSIGTNFNSHEPLLQQTFFIGDGRASGGTIQRFIVPDEATRLFLGFQDAVIFGWPNGAAPGAYQDNTGALTAIVTVHVPDWRPTLDEIADRTIDPDSDEQFIKLTGITAGGGESQPLRVTATSDNRTLIPNPNIDYTSAQSTGQLRLTPITGERGFAAVTVTVEDGGRDGNLDTIDDNLTFARTFQVNVKTVDVVELSDLVVDARSDLSYAGRTTTPDPANRLLPVFIDLPEGTGRWVEFPEINGTVNAGPGWPIHGADGGTLGPANTRGTNILAARGISGALASRFLFLSGVFLNDDLPSNSPDRLDYIELGIDMPSQSPVVQQTYFIGDGRRAGDVKQIVRIPNCATRMFLGFQDSDRFGWPNGLPPFAYEDNTGQLNVDLTIHVPRSIPSLDEIPDMIVGEDFGEQTVLLRGIRAGDDEDRPLRVTATSNNTALIPEPVVVYSSPAKIGSLVFQPSANESGRATITVTVEDGGPDQNLGTANDNTAMIRTFEVIVAPSGFTVMESDDTTVTSENGTTDTFEIVLASPIQQNVTLQVTSLDTGEVTVDVLSLTFGPENWNVPQMVTVTGVDDAATDGDQTVDIPVFVNTEISDPAYVEVGEQRISVVNSDNDDPGFTLSRTTVTVTESGSTETVEIALDARPLTNVVINVDIADSTELAADRTSFTFTPDTWGTPQTVTLTGEDDMTADGAIESLVTFAVDPSNSDGAYETVPAQFVAVTTTDDEVTGIMVNRSDLDVSEDGSTDTFTVKLTARPTSNVVVIVSSDDITEVAIMIEPIVFTPANWSATRLITATGVNDDTVDGEQITNIRLSIDDTISDIAFAALADYLVRVANADNDVGGIVVDLDSVSVSEAGTQETLNVSLSAAPVSDVVLNIEIGDFDNATTSVSTMTFSPSNWQLPQQTTITGVDDDVADGEQTFKVTISIDQTSSHAAFANVGSHVVNGTNADNDIAGIIVTEVNGVTLVSEIGTTDSVSVELSAQPLIDVRIDVMNPDTSEVTIDVTQLVFTPSNWNVTQAVNVTGVNDSITDSDQLTAIEFSIDVGSSDATFAEAESQTVTATTTEFSLDVDDDTTYQTLSDGILFIRFLAGFTGESLISGAVNSSGQRASASQISDWLAPLQSTYLDVDGDGRSRSLTDGILLIRYLAGFTGESLVANAVDEQGSRASPESVTVWLDQFLNRAGSANGPVASYDGSTKIATESNGAQLWNVVPQRINEFRTATTSVDRTSHTDSNHRSVFRNWRDSVLADNQEHSQQRFLERLEPNHLDIVLSDVSSGFWDDLREWSLGH